jgi:hypothetical protein
MGKIFDFLKKYSFGTYRTGLYNNNVITFGSLLSVILSALFLIGLLTATGFYFNQIFFLRQKEINSLESLKFNESELSKYSLQ